jgi:hypothetical protein
MTLLIMGVASCSLLTQALCFHHLSMLSEPLTYEDMEICGLGLKLIFNENCVIASLLLTHKAMELAISHPKSR